MSAVVLDASALLAVLQSEPGEDLVSGQIGGALMSSVNYSEVLKRMLQGGMELELIKAILGELGFRVIPLDQRAAEIAAAIWEETKEFGLSLADRCCLALGIVSGGSVLTADRALMQVKLPVKIKLVRHHSSAAKTKN